MQYYIFYVSWQYTMRASKGSLYIWHAALWDPYQWPSSHRPRWNEMPRRRSNSWWIQQIFCVPSVQDISITRCKCYEIITVKSHQYNTSEDSTGPKSVHICSPFLSCPSCSRACARGVNKAGRGQSIFPSEVLYSLLGSGSWHARLCYNAIAAMLLGISFPLVYPLTQAPRCPCPQTSFVASPQPNGSNSGN